MRVWAAAGLCTALVTATAGCGRKSAPTHGDEEIVPTQPAGRAPAHGDSPAGVQPSKRASWRIKAHRGASFDAPENTLRAVTLAFERGAAACEIDVRLSKDGVPVVFHDEDTKRIGGRERLVRDQTVAELKQLDVGAWKGPAYAGERIATLAEVLKVVPAGRTLFVEIKDGPEAVPKVLDAIKRAGVRGVVAVESFHVRVLEAVRKRQPRIPVHLAVGVERDANGRVLPHSAAVVQRAKAIGATGLAVDARGLTREFAVAVRAARLELGVWTINHPALAKLLRGIPITWLETDRPGLFAPTPR